MITQYINISGYEFKTELLKNNIDLKTIDKVSGEFIMLRSYEFRNSIIYDKDMYFIEKSLFYDYIYKRKSNLSSDNTDLTSGLIFPVSSMDFESFSLNIDDFNNDMSDTYFNELETIDDIINSPLVYRLYKKKDNNIYNNEQNNTVGKDGNKNNSTEPEFEETAIDCDILRIYPPHTNKDIPFIIHIDSYVNNLHVHILARDINWYKRDENKDSCVHSVTETKHNHNIYNEYIEVIIPDIDMLFGGDVFFKENLNYGDIYYIDDKDKDSKLLKRFNEYNQRSNNIIYNSFAIYNIPYVLESFSDVHALNGGYYLVDENNYFLKDHDGKFLVWKQDEELQGAEYLIDKDNYYLKDHLGNYLVCKQSDMDNIYSVSDMTFNIYSAYIKHYIPEYLHTTAKVQMKNSFAVSFIPYDDSVYYNIYNNNNILNEHEHIYNRLVFGFGKHNILVPSNIYNTSRTQFFEFSSIKLQSHIGFDDDGIISLINEFKYPGEKENLFESFNEAYQFFNGIDFDDYINIIDDEDPDNWWDDEIKASMQCGALFEIFNDKYQKDLLYKESFCFKTELDPVTQKHVLKIDNKFAFRLNGLFASWSQFPGIMYIRIRFIDKYLGKIIYGNICTLDKEKFKYLINTEPETGRAIISNNKSSENISSSNMDISKINFLNNIKVNLITNKSVNDNITGTSSSNKPKVIYRPIFYKVNDLQNIIIRMNLIQNIGINLMDYMTKVETFKLVIGSNVITEYARNDAYVIFNINANDILNSLATDTTTGTYHILNQDDEYITSGSWSLIN